MRFFLSRGKDYNRKIFRSGKVLRRCVLYEVFLMFTIKVFTERGKFEFHRSALRVLLRKQKKSIEFVRR